jgi:peptidyl-prolyl cis-trans isomerase B (cyclophilin B)
MSKKVKIITGGKTLNVDLFESTPATAKNFIKLAESGFYKDLKFHRVLPGFVVQGGCPQGTGAGGPGYTIQCECTNTVVGQFHDKGVLSMAHAGRNTGGSQFFIVLGRGSTAHLDGNHTCFGQITEGLDVIDNIKQGDTFTVVVD